MSTQNWQLAYKASDASLATRIADELGITSCQINLTKFADTEVLASSTNLKTCNTILLSNCPPPVGENIMELLLALNLLQNSGIKNIIAVVPYLPYHRQDKPGKNINNSIAAGLIPNLIATSGANAIITLDLYNRTETPQASIPIYSITHKEIFSSDIATFNKTSTIIVAPDQGASSSAEYYAAKFNLPITKLVKKRCNNKVSIQAINNIALGKDCILIDDITDTGSTLIKAAEALCNSGAKTISAFVSHSILSGNAIEQISSSKISKLYTTDSVSADSLSKAGKKFHVKLCSGILAKKLKETIL